MDAISNYLNALLASQSQTVGAGATPTPSPSATAQPDMNSFMALLNAAIAAKPAATTTNPETQARDAARAQVENKFGTDYGERNIASSLLDDTISSILSEQATDARSYLERGRKRGIYNDIGYNAGVSRIGTDAQAGYSKLSTIGNSIIDKYRADANAVRDKAFSAASGLTPGSSFSLDPYMKQGAEIVNRAVTLAPGELRNTFGGTQLFDFGALNNRAGQAQGAINARDLDVARAISDRKRANSFGRGLGSQGAF